MLPNILNKFLHLGQYKTPLGRRFRLLSISLQDRFCGRKEEKRCGNTKGPLGPVQTPLCPCEIHVLMMYVWYSHRDWGKARLKNLKSALWHLYDMSRNSTGFILRCSPFNFHFKVSYLTLLLALSSKFMPHSVCIISTKQDLEPNMSCTCLERFPCFTILQKFAGREEK